MRRAKPQWVVAGLLLVVLAAILTACIHPPDYNEWQWRQYNPNHHPLPGDPDR